MRKISMILAAAAAAALLGAAQAQAQANPPASACLTSNGAPQFVTGTGKASQQNDARTKAQGDWGLKALSFGGAYQFWVKSANRTSNCSSAKAGFGLVHTCTVRAQPCR